MPADLPQGESVMLEQVGYARPVIQQTPDPGQADQADAEFDAARPVNPGQEGILLPPGAEMIGHPAWRTCRHWVRNQAVASSVRCCRREISQTCLTLPTLLLRAVIDAEGVAVRERTGGRSPGRGTSRVAPCRSVTTPRTSHSPRSSRSALARTAALASSGTRAAVSGGRTAVKLRSPPGGRRSRGELFPRHLPPRPGCLEHLVAGAPRHLGG